MFHLDSNQLNHPGFGCHNRMAVHIKRAFKQHIETSYHGGLFGTKTVTTIRKRKHLRKEGVYGLNKITIKYLNRTAYHRVKSGQVKHSMNIVKGLAFIFLRFGIQQAILLSTLPK